MGQKNTVSVFKIDFREPDIRENIVIGKAALNECNQAHAKCLNREKMKKNINEKEEPIIRFPNESLFDYWRRIMERYDKLSKFYNSKKIKRRNWFRERSFESIIDVAINRLIELAGPDKNDVIFTLGDGKFASNNSLHTSFETKLVKKLVALGYRIQSVDEAYTSSKCCRCHCFVQFISMRIKYCTKCDTYFHRDILGAENIIHAGRGIFLTGKKPDYLPNGIRRKMMMILIIFKKLKILQSKLIFLKLLVLAMVVEVMIYSYFIF
jgi:hypothetical protein